MSVTWLVFHVEMGGKPSRAPPHQRPTQSRSVSFVILQLLRSWSKAEAPLNISSISVMLSTRQSFSGWLNAEASQNIPCILVTLSTCQAPSG